MQRWIVQGGAVGLAGAASSLAVPAWACMNEEQEALRELLLALAVAGLGGAGTLVAAVGAAVWWWRGRNRLRAPGVP